MDQPLHQYSLIFPRVRNAATLLAADSIVFGAIYNLLHFLRTGFWLSHFSVAFLGIYIILILTLYVIGAYRPDTVTHHGQYAINTLYGMILVGIISTAFVYALGPNQFTSAFGRGILPATLVLFGAWTVPSRYFASKWVSRRTSRRRWLFIGEWGKFKALAKEFDINPKQVGLIITGDEQNPYKEYQESLLPEDGTLNCLKGSSWDTIILSSYESLDHQALLILMELRKQGTPIHDLTGFFESQRGKIPVLNLENGWFLQDSGFSLLHNRTGIRFKRVTDVILSILFLIPTVPIMIVAGLLICVTSSGPILYSQNRMGLHGRIFQIYKFRTMQENAEAAGAQWASLDDPRVIRFGRFLRSSRLDELPQLWNVLKGDMSFIGPRPERPEFLHQIESRIPFYGIRHLIKPGITGWAQIMYPYGASIEDTRQKLQYDLYYIKNYSVVLDFYILIKTIMVVLSKKGR